MNEVSDAIPFHTYLLKVAQLCNIDCKYCYVYHKEDMRWKTRPKLMNRETITQVCDRIFDHCVENEKTDVQITFHGGEPMLGGYKHLEMLLSVIKEKLIDKEIKCRLGMQTNLTLLNEDLCDLFLNYGMTLGVSLDGPSKFNDLQRVDRRGKPTTHRVEKGLALLESNEKYKKILSGFLAVVDVEYDPIEVYEYLKSFNPRGIDFLLPLENHDRYPKGKSSFESTPYADWLIKIFDQWFDNDNKMRIRYFDSIIRTVLGGYSYVEAVGLTPTDIIVVETDGDIEGVDSLKATFDGATVLGYNIFENSFDEVSRNFAVRQRQVGSIALSKQCQQCDIVNFCGGGYIPHRYSKQNQFDNPSVYCRDIYKLVHHIYNKVQSSIDAIREELACPPTQ